MEYLKDLSQLAPVVAVAIVFGYVMVKKDAEHSQTIQELNTENLQNHKDKTMAFLQDKAQDREMFKEISLETAKALREVASTNNDVSKNLALNTEVTKDMREALRREK